jgi:hypothetical protein
MLYKEMLMPVHPDRYRYSHWLIIHNRDNTVHDYILRHKPLDKYHVVDSNKKYEIKKKDKPFGTYLLHEIRNKLVEKIIVDDVVVVVLDDDYNYSFSGPITGVVDPPTRRSSSFFSIHHSTNNAP